MSEAALPEPVFKGLFDPVTGQVGCVILQAAFGCDRRASTVFDPCDWFTSPTDNMKIFERPLSQWRAAAAKVREHYPDRRGRSMILPKAPTP